MRLKAETLQQLKERIKYCLIKVTAIYKTVGCTKCLIDQVRRYDKIE